MVKGSKSNAQSPGIASAYPGVSVIHWMPIPTKKAGPKDLPQLIIFQLYLPKIFKQQRRNSEDHRNGKHPLRCLVPPGIDINCKNHHIQK